MEMTSNQFSRKSGATLRMLQYWDQRGYLVAARKGRNRRYSARQLQLAKKLVAVSSSGPAIGLKQVTELKFHKVVVVGRPTVIRGTLYIPKPDSATKVITRTVGAAGGAKC